VAGVALDLCPFFRHLHMSLRAYHCIMGMSIQTFCNGATPFWHSRLVTMATGKMGRLDSNEDQHACEHNADVFAKRVSAPSRCGCEVITQYIVMVFLFQLQTYNECGGGRRCKIEIAG
jgi:ABC-type uncharacterized transport system permease subunit